MAYKSREFIDPTKRGRGRLVVSEGIAPAEKIQPDDTLPTLLVDPVHDEFFEAVILKGTIISVYEAPNGSGADEEGLTYVVGPCDGTDYTAGAPDSLKAVPQGVLTQDAYRPFENSENEGASFIVRGYIEWPLVKVLGADGADLGSEKDVLFDNTDLEVGDFVKPDALGRPVKWVAGTDPEILRVGRVLMKESIVDNDFDYGFLQYMQLPITKFEDALLRTVYESTDTAGNKVFGVRPNVDALLSVEKAYYPNLGADTAGVSGCVRVVLSL